MKTLSVLVWTEGLNALPWVPEVFLACGGNLLCRPSADTSSAVGPSRAGHYKDLTETGNRARKVSGTQGINASNYMAFSNENALTWTGLQ